MTRPTKPKYTWDIDDPSKWTWCYNDDRKLIFIVPPQDLPAADYYNGPHHWGSGAIVLGSDDREDDGPEKLADYMCGLLNGTPDHAAIVTAREVLREAQKHIGTVAARLERKR